MVAAVLSMLLMAADVELEPRIEAQREVDAGWARFSQAWGGTTLSLPSAHVRIVRSESLPAGRNGASRLGLIELRQPKKGELDGATKTALAHELAHQFVWV